MMIPYSNIYSCFLHMFPVWLFDFLKSACVVRVLRFSKTEFILKPEPHQTCRPLLSFYIHPGLFIYLFTDSSWKSSYVFSIAQIQISNQTTTTITRRRKKKILCLSKKWQGKCTSHRNQNVFENRKRKKERKKLFRSNKEEELVRIVWHVALWYECQPKN